MTDHEAEPRDLSGDSAPHDAPSNAKPSRTYLGLVEPAGLVANFLANPPLDFLASEVDGTPAFIAPFDLLTTAEPAVKRRVERLPGFKWWGKILRLRTFFVGTTATEYAVFADDFAAEDFAQKLVQRHARDQALVIVKDLPMASPLLDERCNALANRFSDTLEKHGFVPMAGQALAYVPIDFASTDDYLARLSSGRRKDIRRKLKARENLRIERVPTGAAMFDDAAVTDKFFALYENVYSQSEIHFDRLTRDFFAAMLRDQSSGGVVFLYHHDDALIGFNLCFLTPTALVDKYVGFAYPQSREHNLYFVSWMENLRFAAENKVAHYVAGWTDPEIKSYLGASFTMTRHAVYLRNPLLRFLLRRIARFFENDRAWEAADAPGRPGL